MELRRYQAIHQFKVLTVVAQFLQSGLLPVRLLIDLREYVPFQFWTVAHPKIRCILDCALSSYRHELLLENINSHVMQQHGSADDNVPAYHSRRLFQLQLQSRSAPDKTTYVELQGKNHWFDGMFLNSKQFSLKGSFVWLSRHSGSTS